jgi:hypothetical protein
MNLNRIQTLLMTSWIKFMQVSLVVRMKAQKPLILEEDGLLALLEVEACVSKDGE